MKDVCKSLFKAIPSFWADNFEDKDVLESLFQASLSKVSEEYMRAMATPLNMSLRSCVGKYRPECRVITLRYSKTVPFDAAGTTSWWCNVAGDIGYIGALSRSKESSKVLEEGTDFHFYSTEDITNASMDLRKYPALDLNSSLLLFDENPFSVVEDGTPPHQVLGHVTDNYFLPQEKLEGTVLESLNAGDVFYIDSAGNKTKHHIALHLTEETYDGAEPGIYLEAATPAPFSGHVKVSTSWDGFDTYSLSSSVLVKDYTYPELVMYLVAPYPEIDKHYMYNTYGWVFGGPRKSSTEEYRSTLLAKYQYKTKPFTQENLKGTINLFLNLPIVDTDREFVRSVTALASGKTQVSTNIRDYDIDWGIPLSSYIKSRAPSIDGSDNPDYDYAKKPLPSLKIGSVVAEPYVVIDIETGPSGWWYGQNIVLPVDRVPGLAQHNRNVVGNNIEYDNKIWDNTNMPAEEMACIGDYTIVLGAPKRLKCAYAASKDFYQGSMVVVKKNPLGTAFDIPDLAEEHKQFLTDNAPKDVVIIFED